MEKKKSVNKFSHRPPPHKGEKYQQFRTGIQRNHSKLVSTNDESKTPDQSSTTAVKKRRKRAKVVLSFDEDDRRSFLTGFQKRKAERKQRGKHELDNRVKEEMKRIKDKQQEKLKQLYQDVTVAKILDEDNAEYTVNYDLPEQSVSIMGVDIVNISGSLGLSMGVNKPKTTAGDEEDQAEDGDKKARSNDSDEDDDDDDSKVDSSAPLSGKNLRSNLKQIKRVTTNALKNSKILKVKQRLNTKKARQQKRFGKGKKSTSSASSAPSGSGGSGPNNKKRN